MHIYLTAVPISGQGNFVAFPIDEPPPKATILNYRAGVQNIGNAGSVKTYCGTVDGKDVGVLNRYAVLIS